MISFTGRETMLTAGLKEVKKVTKSIEESSGYFNALAPHGAADSAAAEVAKTSRANAVNSYKASHQQINLANDSAKSGATIEYFG